MSMESENRVNPDVFYGECATSEEALEKLKGYWDQISRIYPVHLQAYIHSKEWLKLLGVFVDRWGVECTDVDIFMCCRMIHDEQPVLEEQLEEKDKDVIEIRKHREWIESPNPPFPRDLISSCSQDWYFQTIWIPKVETFIRKWTSVYVPDDVKRSLAEVKERYPVD